jgi:antitoxin ParD1/3/4
MPNVTISLPENLKVFIEEQISTKGYGNVSEYFRSLLRSAQEHEKEAHLESLLLEGLASGGDDIRLDRRFWKDLKSEAMTIASKRRPRKKR